MDGLVDVTYGSIRADARWLVRHGLQIVGHLGDVEIFTDTRGFGESTIRRPPPDRTQMLVVIGTFRAIANTRSGREPWAAI
jgi:hypothetical protein